MSDPKLMERANVLDEQLRVQNFAFLAREERQEDDQRQTESPRIVQLPTEMTRGRA